MSYGWHLIKRDWRTETHKISGRRHRYSMLHIRVAYKLRRVEGIDWPLT